MSAARERWLLERIAVGEVWGVGRRIGSKLEEMGITTVQLLKEASPRDIRARFGVVMERTCNELRGLSCLALEEISPPRQEIVSSRSFGELVNTLDELAEAVSMYVTRAAEKLRGQQSLCGALHVFVQTNPFRRQDEQYSNGLTIPLTDPTDDTRALAGAALQGLRAIYRPGYLYKKAGVMLMNLSPNTMLQGSLFDGARPREDTAKVMAVLDALNRRYGRDTLVLGSAGT